MCNSERDLRVSDWRFQIADSTPGNLSDLQDDRRDQGRVVFRSIDVQRDVGIIHR